MTDMIGPSLLRQWVRANGVSVRRLAEMTGINKNRIARAMRGASVRVDLACALERVTGIPASCWN
jgi:transcriptional regulator with XRE-family HTH domain